MENCYLLVDASSRDAVLVDPGDDAVTLLQGLADKGARLREVWLTHAHFDHVGALADVLAEHDVPVRMHADDGPLLAQAAQAAARWDIRIKQPPTRTLDLQANQVLTLGDTSVTCLFTPGHAPGHISFYVPSQQFVLAGDALFQGSIGRTDLPMGNHAQLLESIHSQLLTLPDDTVVYPGHGPATRIGIEKRSNPFLQS